FSLSRFLASYDAFGFSIPAMSGRSRPTRPEAVAVPAVALPRTPARVPPRSWPPPSPPMAPSTVLSIGPSDLALLSIPPTFPPTAPLTSCTNRDVTSIGRLLRNGELRTAPGQRGEARAGTASRKRHPLSADVPSRLSRGGLVVGPILFVAMLLLPAPEGLPVAGWR